MVKMNRLAVAEALLLSHQFSFGVNGGVQHAILTYNIALEIRPSRLMLDLDSKNAHALCSMDNMEEGLELDVTFH